jgi:peptidoglycan lytic transglycosylase B
MARPMKNLKRFKVLARAAAAAAVLLASVPAMAADGQSFAVFLDALRQEALARGISQATVTAALSHVEYIPRVIERDRQQPEFTQTLDQYLARRVTDEIVAKGRALLAENRALLEKIQAQYQVQPRFLVALWGIETKYGEYTGGYEVIPALVTLAYDDRRKDKFREELFDALEILDRGDIRLSDMMGSWAGAMGQTQFMPSVFRLYAVDYDGDGLRDIWWSLPDVLASAANYLHNIGWNGSEGWGMPARLPPGFDHSLANPFDHRHGDMSKTMADWETLGVRTEYGTPLPNPSQRATLILPDGPDGTPYLVTDNFLVLLSWNPAFLFAVTVGTLADRLGPG